MKTTTSYTKIICIYASFVLCSAAAQSTNSTVRDCQDLQNTTITCTGCLNNTLGLKCKYLLQEGTTGSCKNLDAPLETNATSVTSIGDCGDPFLGTDANGTVAANNTSKLTNVSESNVMAASPPLTNTSTSTPAGPDTTTLAPTTAEPPTTVTESTTTTTTPTTTSTAATTPSTTTTTATTTSAPTTTETTTTLIPTTNATTTETTTAPTTPSTSTTPSGNVTTEAPTTPTTVNPSPAPASRGFDSASFFGGIVLVLGLLGIGYFGVRVYRQRVDRSYHTL